MISERPVVVANYHCQLGENPLWNAADGHIYWEDIDRGRLFRADHATLEHECFHEGPVVGGFTFQADGSLLLFEQNRIARLDPHRGGRRVLVEGVDSDMVRFNDVIADPEGRVFAGTIGKTRESGGLYRVDRDGSVRCVWKGTQIANGMGFTADLRRFYWTCSTSGRIFIADYDRERGELANRRLFYAVPESEGSPDGMCVDTTDCVWTARWGGGSVLRFDPEAKLLGRVELPVPKVSSVTFGGPELDTLYVTTAGGDGARSVEGTLYRVKTSARGKLPFLSRIAI
ncbi:MAG: SMP-30/gluconolactonase/LRE family protein [Myxococcota bacterium]